MPKVTKSYSKKWNAERKTNNKIFIFQKIVHKSFSPFLLLVSLVYLTKHLGEVKFVEDCL